MKSLVLFLLILPRISTEFYGDFIAKYFRYRSVGSLNVYGCFNKKEEIRIHKELTDFLIRTFDVSGNFELIDKDIFTKYNEKLGIVFDSTNCPNITDIIEKFSNKKTFTLTHIWLILADSNLDTELTFENAELTVSSDLKMAIFDDHKRPEMLDIYNPAKNHGGNLKISNFSEWYPENQTFSSRNRKNLYWTRRDMTGITFKALVVLPKPFPGKLEDYLILDDSEREINSFNRFHAVVSYHVRDFYNYTIDISMTKSWGYKARNGTFDGLVRALELRQVDFGASPLFVKDERWPALDYGRRTWILGSAFVFRIPKRPASFEVFMRPLDIQVWNLTVVAFVIIVILLKLTLKNEVKQIKNEVLFESSWSHITLFTLGTLCQQGSDVSPSGISSRIAFIFIFVFAVLLYQYYNASIVAILVMTPARFINNLADLANGPLTLLCENTLYNMDYVNKLINDPVVGILSKKSPKGTDESFYVEPDVALPKVARGGYAFHVELATAYPIISKTFDEDAICSLDEIEMFRIQQMHQPLQKGSPFKEMLDHVLHKIDESGLMHRQQEHWHARKPACIRSRPATSSVSIEEFYPALSLLLFGILLSLLVLILEYGFSRFERLKEEKRLRQVLQNRRFQKAQLAKH